ncbi:MAG: tetratricopeptide repeat protein [Anaerolineaceae bacterium]|nr:tetratricopeptide repeat protein [Anaerolineaceae bacterium]
MAKKPTKTGKKLERRVADAYRAMGARKVEHDVELAGHQIDAYVEMETADRALHRIAVEAKDYSKPVGIEIVSGFAAVVAGLRTLKLVDEGVVVSAAGFSRPARNAAKEHGLRLLEPTDLDTMVNQKKMAASILPTAPEKQIPHNLPPRSEFIGREEEKTRVHDALKSRSYLISIDGIGGIGKTSLALEIAYECLRTSKEESTDIVAFEGFIWTTAKDRDLTLNTLLDSIAFTLECQGIVQRPIEEKLIAVRKLLQAKPYLLVVDNFETVTDEGFRDFLLKLPEPSKALITTREQNLQEVRAISIKGLAKSEALALIRHEGERLGLESLQQADDSVLLRLYEATGGAPLAIKWAIGQIKRKGQSLDTVLTALHEARGNIFDNVFSRSWDLLSKEAQQVLIVMPLFATSASHAAIEAISDVHHFTLDEALGQLVEMSLLEATDELDLAWRRYSVHPLTRAFARVRLQQEMGFQHTAEQRLTSYFQRLAEENGGSWNQEGFPHIENDIPNILSTIQWCFQHGRARPAFNILLNISSLMLIRGYWVDAMALGQQAFAAAVELKDELNAARFQVLPISWIHRHQGDLHSAEQQISQALAVFKRLGKDDEAAYAKRHLGRVYQERGELEPAKSLLKEALAFYRSRGDKRRIYYITAHLAGVALEEEEVDTAWEMANSVLAPARQLGEPGIIAWLLGVLGGVARRRGDYQQAKAFFEESLSLRKQANQPDRIADMLFELAQIEIKTGNVSGAKSKLHEAKEIYKGLGIQSKAQAVKAQLETV